MSDFVGKVLEGDCIEVMASMEAESIHSICTDPPYGLSFMGHDWDSFGSDLKKYQEWSRRWAVEAYRVLRPGGYLLSFSATRTFHRMVCGIEDAGFEIKDQIDWIYAQGFPKNSDISKHIDELVQKEWVEVKKVVYGLPVKDLRETWEKSVGSVSNAGVEFLEGEESFVLVHVARPRSLKKELFSACVAELRFCGPEVTSAKMSTVLKSVDDVYSKGRAWCAENQFRDKELICLTDVLEESTGGFTVLGNAVGLQDGKIKVNLRAVEVLKTFIGKEKFLKKETINALCVALIEDLRRIISSRSKTFLSLDMKLQMDFVSAMTVITTKFMAESLILFMVDILKSEIERAINNSKRKVIGKKTAGIGTSKDNTYGFDPLNALRLKEIDVTAPESEDAKKWAGWGTALKPAHEPICVAQKPIEQSSIIKQVLVSGTGGINVDATRIGSDKRHNPPASNKPGGDSLKMSSEGMPQDAEGRDVEGRWPSNLIMSSELDGVAPFFYVPKPSNEEKWLYCRVCAVVFGKETKMSHMTHLMHCKTCKIAFDPVKDTHKDHDTDANVSGHPTAKPVDLMRYLCRLVTAKDGIILDPFLGSGTTAIGANAEGFKWVGIERDPTYVKMARERIKWQGSQMTLF